MTISFSEAAASFEAAESASDSFKLLYKSVLNLIKSDPGKAAYYFVIGVASHSYVLEYEDQGVSPEISDAAKIALVSLNAKVLRALASPPDVALQLLSEVAYHYQVEIHNF
jgi:hypothetical protein